MCTLSYIVVWVVPSPFCFHQSLKHKAEIYYSSPKQQLLKPLVYILCNKSKHTHCLGNHILLRGRGNIKHRQWKCFSIQSRISQTIFFFFIRKPSLYSVLFQHAVLCVPIIVKTSLSTLVYCPFNFLVQIYFFFFVFVSPLLCTLNLLFKIAY